MWRLFGLEGEGRVKRELSFDTEIITTNTLILLEPLHALNCFGTSFWHIYKLNQPPKLKRKLNGKSRTIQPLRIDSKSFNGLFDLATIQSSFLHKFDIIYNIRTNYDLARVDFTVATICPVPRVFRPPNISCTSSHSIQPSPSPEQHKHA